MKNETTPHAHVFVFNAKPAPASEYDRKASKAIADVWVSTTHASSAEDAEAMARAYIMDYGWVITSLVATKRVSEQEVLHYPQDAQASFRQAIKHGISAFFVSSPLQDREDNTVEIHRMAPPHHRSGNKH